MMQAIKASRIKVQDKISIFRADQRLQEVENLAAEIKKNMMDHGWKYSQIGVSSPQLNHYRSLLQAVLTRYDIPYDLRENKPLKWALPIKHLENLLRIVNENYPIKSIQSILQSSFFSYHIKLQNSGFIKILMALRFRQGKSEILHALENEKKFYHTHVTEEVQNSEEGENYQKLIEVLKELINEVKFFEKPQLADSIFQHLVNIIQRHRFLDQIYREAEGHHEDLAFENFEALHTFISALFTWVELSAKILPGKKYSVTEFLEVFSLLTEAESYSSCPPRHYGVQIFPLANLSGQDFSALYILGMEDGVLPDVLSLKFTHPQYLPEQLASYLPTDPLLYQREIFLEMLQFPAKLIQFSYACHYKDNPILPSLFLRELERISSSNLEKGHKIRLYTSSDILESLEIENTFADNTSYGEAKVPIGFETFISAKMLHFFQHRLKVNKLREPYGGDSIWAGNLFQDKLSSSWLDISFKHKRFSPTQLEVFAKCPMLYFLQRLLFAQPLEEGQEFLSPLDRGIVLHKILFRFFRNTAKRDLKSLLAIANEELEKIPVPRGILWDIEKGYYLGGSNQKGQITEFWEYEEQSSRAYLTTPRHFEWSFGEVIDNLDVVDTNSTETPFVWTRDGESFHFKGKIDRIELSKQGLILIVDYKTGNIPTLGEMWNGERLQLPIYLKAAQGLLQSKKISLQIGGAAFYVIRKGKEIEKKVVFLDRTAILGAIKLSSSTPFPNDKYVVDGNPQTIPQFIDRVFNYSADYILNIRKGHFQHTEDPKKCRRWDGKVCDFMPLCKVNWRKQQTVIP
jgi:ATP-dependent helicase/DNAse subunit B